MALGGEKLCGGCLTMSASWTGGRCSACMARESMEQIAQRQMNHMSETTSQSGTSNRAYTRNDIMSFLYLWLVVMAIGTVIWLTGSMSWVESIWYVFWWPIKMFFALVIYIASFGAFNLF